MAIQFTYSLWSTLKLQFKEILLKANSITKIPTGNACRSMSYKCHILYCSVKFAVQFNGCMIKILSTIGFALAFYKFIIVLFIWGFAKRKEFFCCIFPLTQLHCKEMLKIDVYFLSQRKYKSSKEFERQHW